MLLKTSTVAEWPCPLQNRPTPPWLVYSALTLKCPILANPSGRADEAPCRTIDSVQEHPYNAAFP